MSDFSFHGSTILIMQLDVRLTVQKFLVIFINIIPSYTHVSKLAVQNNQTT
jgi:hypothetical protein